MGSVGPIKLWNWKTDDCKTQVMSMYSSMNIKHNNCTVNIGQFQLKIDFQAIFKLMANLVAYANNSNSHKLA